MSVSMHDGVPFSAICLKCKQRRGAHYTMPTGVLCPAYNTAGYKDANTKGITFEASTLAEEQPLAK